MTVWLFNVKMSHRHWNSNSNQNVKNNEIFLGGDKTSEFNLSLMNLDTESLGIPETEFNSICTLPSSEFGRICREFGSLSETIKIDTNKENVKFSIAGEIGAGNTVLNQKDTGNEN